ncbi:dehydrogenase/reductase SDR family member 4-like isoform X2 [Cataglyphis hispanica]|uniref:dehydrogenase/reductase SDR family member 4-like isoform X2 n=1 Tax=Cataglyphis hispanica TaxID=1086592 RepID=UPI00217F87DA|nr:dehydrogenase/reductase SDR family member 4-like isoform X2 [Cataglyphis hispanica]
MLRASIIQSVRRYSSNIVSPVKCNRLEDKIAIVTASTDGIGLSIAKRLAQEGAKVMISSRKELNVKNAVEELRSEGLQVSGVVCHVGKAEDRKNLFEKTKANFGGLDILISNAALNPSTGHTLDNTEEVWDKIFDINLKSTFLLMKESLPLLNKSFSPSIITIASIAAYRSYDFLSTFKSLGIYSISKTALLSLTGVIATELAPQGIRVNCIAPGLIKTKFSKKLYDTQEPYDFSMSKIAMKRLGTSEEIASVAAFLASDDASYITGETIAVTGGLISRL